ncbi:hypothetical protein B0H11DRAFT_1935272 [Mycena galericulata]|nr:hypothetical protein B0H11DRAFT_1935272 [Mycena galericulata]
MSIALTFTEKHLLESPIVGPEGAVHYTITTSRGLMGRKATTIGATSGLVGVIDWREETFNINGFQRKIETLKAHAGGILNAEREWNWGYRPFHLKYHDWHTELLATPKFEPNPGMVRFTPFQSHLLHDNKRAVIYFPYQMQDEFEKMFLLMAILQTEIHRQDVQR